MSRELTWLRRVRDLAQRLATHEDASELLPDILAAAVELTEAERGFLVLVEGRDEAGLPRTRVVRAHGFSRADLAGPDVQISRRVVREALALGHGLVGDPSSHYASLLDASSVQAARVRSLACLPVRSGSRDLGVLYLDHRYRDDAFQAADLPLLETFATQVALALEWVRERPPSPPGRRGRLVGLSPAMHSLSEEVSRAARCQAPALILGEVGSGHEQVARELHARGADPEAPFAAQSCDLSTLALLERLEALTQPARGTLWLREVEQLTPDMQTWLLERISAGLGSQRLIASTHVDLRQLAEADEFRLDLFYRLDVLRLVVPPLRQRKEDVPLLLEEALGRLGRRLEISPPALERLQAYSWPGNLRELDNEAQRLAAQGARRIGVRHLSPELREARGVRLPAPRLEGMTLSQVEAHVIQAALSQCEGNKARAARQLGVPRSTLYHLLDRHGLQ